MNANGSDWSKSSAAVECLRPGQSTEDPQRAVARRHDHLVLVLGNVRRKRGRDMQDVSASVDRLAPAGVLFQLGGKE